MIHNFELFTFTGWGVLVFFDTEEHPFTRSDLAQIPRLGAQWKIIFDAKFGGFDDEFSQGLLLDDGGEDNVRFQLSFKSSKIRLSMWDGGGLRVTVVGDQIAKVGEWTRFEMTHKEEEDGKYFLFMSVDGKVVGKEEVAIPRKMELADVHVSSFAGVGGIQRGILRRLVVLQK